MLTQDELRQEVGRRLQRSGFHPDEARHFQEGSLPPALAQEGVSAIVVLSSLDLRTFIDCACSFTSKLSRPQRESWYRSFTRTIFLVGNPANLEERFTFAHVSEDRSVAWMLPAPQGAHVGLRRLLRRFEAPLAPPLPPRISCPVPGKLSQRESHSHQLHLDVSGLSTEAYLIHLNHTLCESIIEGLLSAGDGLELIHEDGFSTMAEPRSYIRVHRDMEHATRLRAYAYLTRGITDD